MKKLILSLLFLMLCGYIFAQQNVLRELHPSMVKTNAFLNENSKRGQALRAFQNGTTMPAGCYVEYTTKQMIGAFEKYESRNGLTDKAYIIPVGTPTLWVDGIAHYPFCGNRYSTFTEYIKKNPCDDCNKKNQDIDFGNQSIHIPAGGIWSDPVPTQTLTGNLQRDITSIPLQKQEEITFNYDPCKYWREKYPHMFATWDRTGDLDSFYGPDRMAMRKCVKGRSFAGRHWWMVPVGLVTTFFAGDLITDGNFDLNWVREVDVNTPNEYWGPNDSGEESRMYKNNTYKRLDYPNQPRGIIIPIFN